MGLNISAYVQQEGNPKCFVFAPLAPFQSIAPTLDDPEAPTIRMTQPLRGLLNLLFNVDFRTADNGIDFSEEEAATMYETLKNANKERVLLFFHQLQPFVLDDFIEFFRISVENKYRVFIN